VGFELVGLEGQIGVFGADGLERFLLLHHRETPGLEFRFRGGDGGVDALGPLGFDL
jgi:hypothetical protein